MQVNYICQFYHFWKLNLLFLLLLCHSWAHYYCVKYTLIKVKAYFVFSPSYLEWPREFCTVWTHLSRTDNLTALQNVAIIYLTLKKHLIEIEYSIPHCFNFHWNHIELSLILKNDLSYSWKHHLYRGLDT